MNNETDIPPVAVPEEEKFEIALRLLGNEILAMSLLSQSKKKNWIVFGLIALVLLVAVLEKAVPLIQMLGL